MQTFGPLVYLQPDSVIRTSQIDTDNTNNTRGKRQNGKFIERFNDGMRRDPFPDHGLVHVIRGLCLKNLK